MKRKWRGNETVIVELPIRLEYETPAGRRAALADIRKELYYGVGCFCGSDNYRAQSGKPRIQK